MIELKDKYETTGRMLKSKLSRTDRQTFRPRFRWEMLIHIWISPKHWKDASGERDHWEVISSMYSYVWGHKCISTYV